MTRTPLEDRVAELLRDLAERTPIQPPVAHHHLRAVDDHEPRPGHAQEVRVRSPGRRWLTIAAGLIVVIGLALAMITRRSPTNAHLQTPPTSAPGATSAAPSIPASTAVVIPAPDGAGDLRDPIQRFLGVPADPAAATVWQHDVEQQATVECMHTSGFTYLPQPFEASTNPNTAIVDGLPADQQTAYQTALDGPDGCEQQAIERTNLLPAMRTEYAELTAQIDADDQVIAARAELTACLVAAGHDPNNPPDTNDPTCATQRSAVTTTLADADERLAPRWIRDHATQLIALRDDVTRLELSASHSIIVGLGHATAEPSTVAAGHDVTLTPAAMITPTCGNVAALLATSADHTLIGQVTAAGAYHQGPDVTWLACATQPTTASTTYPIPDNVPAGRYLLCSTEHFDPDGCATINITTLQTPATASPPSVNG